MAGEIDDLLAQPGQPSTHQDQGIDDLIQTTPSATLREKASAVGEGMAGGALESVGVIPGAIGGAMIGGAVGGPPGAVVGGLAGAGYGMWAGHTARTGLGLRNPEEMPQEVRKYGVLGESFGGSAGALGMPYGAAMTGFRLGESVAGKLLNRMIDSAKTMPVRFGLVEASTAASSAGAAMSAETLFPGKVGARMTAEMAGGLLNPSKLVTGAATQVGGFAKSVVQTMSPTGRETAAAKMIAEVAAKTGEDISQAYQVYRALGVIDVPNLTPAQKTGSMALGALEDHLADYSGKFDLETKRKAMEGLDVLRGHIALLTRTGDPDALKAAAQARDVYYRTLIQGRVDSAMATAEKAVGKITKDTPEARAMLSVKVREVLDQSIVDARKAETELWQKWVASEGDNASGFENLKKQFATEYDNVLPEYRPARVPGPVEKFLARVGKTGDETFVYDPTTLSLKSVPGKAPGATVGEMYQLRSELLNEARQLSIAGDHSGARSMSNLAESVIDDLGAAVSPQGQKLYDDARGFTKEFHDAFTRSFVGKMESVGKYGDRIAPELTLRRALASGSEAGAVQLGEIEQATRFLLTRGLQDTGAVNVVMDAQDRFLRLAAAEAVNPETGKLNPDRLRKFMQTNEILMNRFPGVKTDLGDAIKTTRAAQRMESLAKGQNQLMNDQKVFSKIVKSDGLQEVQKALLSDNMERDLGKLITMVKKGTVDASGRTIVDTASAVPGLRAAVYGAAINASTGRNRGELNLEQVKSLLFTPPPGQKSAIQILQEADIVSPREVGKIKQVFSAMESIQRSQRAGTAVEVKEDMTDAAMTLFGRAMGSNIAVSASKAVGSNNPSLIVAGAGARFAQFMLTKLKVTSAREMLIDAISDPSSGKLDLIMQQASRMTPKQQLQQATQMNAWMVSLGIDIVKNPTFEQDQPYTGPGTKEQIK